MKRAFFFVLVVLCIFSFISCENETIARLGSICVNVQDNSKAIRPSEEDLTVVRYIVSGIHSNGVNSFEPNTFSSSSFTVNDLLVGTWVVTVEGENSKRAVVFSQTQDIEVVAAETTYSNFKLQRLIGEGTFELTIKWPASNTSVASVDVTISNEDVQKEETYYKEDAQKSGSDYVLTKNFKLNSGSYYVTYVSKDEKGNTIGTINQDLNIYKDLTIQATEKLNDERIEILPVFSPNQDVISIDTPITLSTVPSDATVYYTKDGTNPVTSLTRIKYTEPFTIQAPAMLQAVAIQDDGSYSQRVAQSYNIKLNAPVCSLEGGTYDGVQTVTFSSLTPGVVFYYTTDGSTPSKTHGTQASSVQIEKNTRLSVIATYANWIDSDVISVDYKIKEVVSSDLRPGTYNEEKQVKLSAINPNSYIYYTLDGSEPTVDSARYTDTITLGMGITKLKAFAFNIDGEMDKSSVISCEYNIAITIPVETPVFSLNQEGVYEQGQTLELSCATKGARIYYTVDGSEPTQESSLYTTAIALNQNTIVRAYAVKEGMADSQEVRAAYKIKVGQPTFDLDTDSVYYDGQTLELSCETEGASIYYTLDGSNPTQESSLYTSAIELNEKTIVRAYAVKDNMVDSLVVGADYKIKVNQPVFSLSDEEVYDEAKQLEISTSTKEAIIYYTLDGSTPTSSSNRYDRPITISKPTEVKAIAIKHNLIDSEMTSASYIIDGKGALVIDIPTIYELSIEVPETWENRKVVPGVNERLNAIVSPIPEDVSFSWYLDGTPVEELISATGAIVNTTDALYLGTNAVNLKQGPHIITLIAEIEGELYSTSLNVIASYVDSVGEAGINDEIELSGGLIFYDKGYYSDGWRYLEAAPADLRLVNEIPTVDSNMNGYSIAPVAYLSGYYRDSANDNNMFVNGTYAYDPVTCTSSLIEYGESNTQKLIDAMEDGAWELYEGGDTTSIYAAKLCDELIYDSFDDWFLPSSDELTKMFNVLGKIESFTQNLYWSSSEYGELSTYADLMWCVNLCNGMCLYKPRKDLYCVRPVRAF